MVAECSNRAAVLLEYLDCIFAICSWFLHSQWFLI